ncbi:MAG: helix-turn-helix transcriptional regulator [Solirubrobacteraceae bacterium]
MSEQPDKELTALGKSIREGREAKAMTPAELARAANIEREDLEALEAGRLAPTDDFMLRLSTGLGIDPDSFGGYLDPAAAVAAFGRRLRERRESGGLSREALGYLTGVHPTAIQRFEKGRRDPRLTSILRLARGLRLPPRVLVEDDAERPDPPVADAA